jgi:fructose-bisphosphate aldolase class I
MEIIDMLSNKKGFIAALDQSGGSSKRTLANYGIKEDLITSDDVMFDYIHNMRSRIITSDAFNEKRILGVILFKNTMERDIDGVNTVKYLSNKGIPAFLKIDVGLEDVDGGVQLLKNIPNLEETLENAKSYGIIGTKMRSVIKEYNEYGIKKVVEQQFNLAKVIMAHGLIPIIEPEVDIHANNKKQIETFMRNEILKHLDKTKKEDYLMFKFTLPEIPNFYNELLRHKNVLRIVALSGGYERDLACSKLKQNKKMIASFSRALLEGLNVDMSNEEFNGVLDKTIEEIYEASVKKEK